MQKAKSQELLPLVLEPFDSLRLRSVQVAQDKPVEGQGGGREGVFMKLCIDFLRSLSLSKGVLLDFFRRHAQLAGHQFGEERVAEGGEGLVLFC